MVVCSILLLTAAPAAQPTGARNLILITLDGARMQEIFGGLDIEVLRAGLKKDERLEARGPTSSTGQQHPRSGAPG